MAANPDRRRGRVLGRVREFVRVDAPGNHRGALSPAVAILAVMIFTLAGLVIDGGRQLGAKSRAVGYAQEAARVGAATIQLNSDEARIDVAKAGTAIAAFCAQVSSNDPAVTKCAATKVTDELVDISVEINNKTTFLGMVGKPSLLAKGTGQAHAEQGVKKADDSPKIPPIIVGTTNDLPGVPVTNTAVPPTLDIPCPEWTIGSPTPVWTISFPLPPTCTPSITPSPDPTDTSPSPDPTDTTPGTPPTGGGAPNGAGLPKNSVPPGLG